MTEGAAAAGSDLDEEPGGDQGQAAVLTVEAVVVGVEGKVVQVEEPGREQTLAPEPAGGGGGGGVWAGLGSPSSPQPVALAGVGVAADGVVLVSQPHDEDDVEGRGGVVEELRHDGLHACRQEVTSARTA